MRNLLQDKRVVAVLALVAVLAVGWRLQGYWHRFFPASTAAAREVAPEVSASAPATITTTEPASTGSGLPTPAPVNPPSQGSVLPSLGAWEAMFPLGNLHRDPFGPMLAPVVIEPVPEAPLQPLTDLTLQAICVEPHQAFVVINHQVRAVGEHVGEFIIESISSTEVWLKHPAGRKMLSMEFARSGQGKNPSAAGSIEVPSNPPKP